MPLSAGDTAPCRISEHAASGRRGFWADPFGREGCAATASCSTCEARTCGQRW